MDDGTIWDRMARLERGWDGHDAKPPTKAYMHRAMAHAETARLVGLEPSRIAPLAVGGVGVTYRRDGRSVYVQFFNDRGVFLLFLDGIGESKSLNITGFEAARPLLESIRAYLETPDDQTSGRT